MRLTPMRVLLLAAVVACSPGRADPIAPGPHPAAVRSPDAAASCTGGDPFDEGELRAQIAFLASPELDGRAPGSSHDAAARAFVVEQFRCLGLTPAGDHGTFEQAFDDTANVVGYIPGNDDIIVVGAHHDHLGDEHLGANDDASGVAALLSIARAIRQRPDAPHRTIAFVAFGAEEQGEHGSTYFAAHAPDTLPIDRVVYDVNLDMVGSYASRGFVAAMGTFRKLPARTILDELDRAHPKLSVGLGGRGERSDHEPFCALGIPYVFFWTPDRRCYHEKCDTIDNVDLPHLAEIATLAGGLVERLADTEVDLAASKRRLGCAGVRRSAPR